MTEKSYKPYLDGIRGISILIVIISHGGLGHIIPGGFGVTIFFFVSGYLITSLLLEEKNTTGGIQLNNFYMRRLWRLMPALIVYVLFSMAVAAILGQKLYFPEPLSAIFYYSNYYKIYINYQSIRGTYSPYDMLWSLAVEEHFYLFFAPLIAFINNRKAMLACIFSLLFFPLVGRLIVTQFTSATFANDYNYRATEVRIDSIVYGCLLALIKYKNIVSRKSMIGVFFGLLGILFSFVFRDEYFRQVFRYSLQGICLYFVLEGVIYSENMKRMRLILSGSFIVFIGKLSYSIYLYHVLALIGMIIFIGPITLTPMWQLGYWVATVGLAACSYYMVERPTLKLRAKYGSHAQ